MTTAISTKLSESERRKFNDLDGIIRRGLQTFAEVGASLAIIRDQRLYREEYDSFEAYCKDRCGWTRQRADQLIAAHGVVAELQSDNGSVVIPEMHARELAPVPDGQRAEALAVAKEIATDAGRAEPTAKDVREARKRYTPVKDRKPRKQKHETPEDAAAAHRADPGSMSSRRTHGWMEEPKHKQSEGTTSDTPDACRETGTPECAPVAPPSSEPPKADGPVDTAPVSIDTEASSEDAASSPRASSVEGSVVLFVRTLAVPCFEDVDGMTDADAERVALLRAWCGDVLESYRKHRRQTS